MVLDFKNEQELDFSLPEHKQGMLDAFARIDAEKGSEYPLIVNGERIMTEKKTTVISPSTKEVLGYMSSCDEATADLAIKTADEAYIKWGITPVEERITCIRRLTALLKRDRYYFDALNVEENGKNWGEADGELCEAVDFFNSYCMFMRELAGGIELVPNEHEENQCVYIPLGVGVALPPWNFPLSIMAGMVISAVITGNTVVLKPASNTPITAYKFVELCEEAGIPKGVINFIPGSGGVIGDFLTRHPLTRFVNFTGSKAVGTHINSQIADMIEGQKWIKRIVAEMGGKNAIIVDSSADLDKAAEGIVTSAFSLQGQKCSACSRAIVMSDIHDELVEKIVERASYMLENQGSGRDNAPMGAVIDQHAYDTIMGYIDVAREEGEIVYGGHGSDEKGFYIEPTVVTGIKRTDRIAQEEIFGPVLAVIKVDSFDEALDIANDTEYGLTGSVYTKDRQQIQRAKVEFHVGNLYFNHKSTGALVLNHPFGGFNMSGTDAKTGTKGYLMNFLNLKSICETLEY